jgi:UDP-N-acetyl-alpha-D-muramoyl-L-alanyl-L-glutamate epimerase
MNTEAPLSGQQKYEYFRQKFPFLEYRGYSVSLDSAGFHVSYEFNLADQYSFRPGFSIPRRRLYKHFPATENLAENPVLRNLISHIGMIELISYWKAACPPKVIVRNQLLSQDQISWFKNVYFQGLGEFFYTNGIQVDPSDFMQIESEGETFVPEKLELDEAVLVPIGGGKDSVVTLELLEDQLNVRPFIMNPRGATLECVRVAGFGNDGFAMVNRRIDPLLLELNANGFLNGHTPFSAMLAFYTLLIARIAGHRHIALSNESSANEPTIPGTQINHQYSKSYAFEKAFREYTREYISPDFNYFSFLRPLNELQIARLFSEQVRYYPVFKSCNAGSKTDSWCCNCPKCLFAFTILSPFVPMIELIHIFGKNLFELPEMIGYLKELTGLDDAKPFECVGTISEVNTALHMFVARHSHEKLPLLIDYYTNTVNFGVYGAELEASTLKEFNPEHFLDPAFLAILRKRLA